MDRKLLEEFRRTAGLPGTRYPDYRLDEGRKVTTALWLTDIESVLYNRILPALLERSFGTPKVDDIPVELQDKAQDMAKRWGKLASLAEDLYADAGELYKQIVKP